jgi:ubiquitin-protein ligase
MQSASRIRKELREVSEGKSDGIEAHLLSTDNLTHWRGSILGPDDTPYAGGKFLIDIIIPPQYPFEPPKMKL